MEEEYWARRKGTKENKDYDECVKGEKRGGKREIIRIRRKKKRKSQNRNNKSMRKEWKRRETV